MANAGTFKKGEKRPGQGRPKGSGNKSTANAREAIARFVDGNVDRLNQWLDEVYVKDGPKAAFNCFSDLIEYHVPKLARHEVTGQDGGPMQQVTRIELVPLSGNDAG
jgi:hypothetical protein